MFCLLNRFGSPSIRQCYPILSKLNVRDLSISRKPKHVKLADPSVHKVVYSFKYIRLCAGILASKLYFPVISAIIGSCGYYYLHSWNPIVLLIVSNAVHLTFMVGASKFLNNVVGAVFVNREGEINEVIFSSIDKWGRRVDRKHKVDEIFVIGSNIFVTSAGFFLTAVENSDVKYKVNFKHGNIYDPKICNILFDNHGFELSKKK